ncbi:DUF4012 domain-containing protein [Patescibacteria group bacterium]
MVEDIKKIETIKIENTVKVGKKAVKDGSKYKNKKLKKVVFFSFIGFLVLLGLIFGSLAALALPVANQLRITSNLGKEAYTAIKQQDLVLVDEKIKATNEAYLKANSSFKKLLWAKYIPVLGRYISDADLAFKAGESGLKAALVLIESITPYADVLGFKGEGSFTGGTAEDRIALIIETLDKVTPKIEDVKNNLDNVNKNLGQINPDRYPKQFKNIKVREQIIAAQDMAKSAAVVIADAQPALQSLPAVLGYPDPREYLVIMQNDGELRPTGGFMTAYAIIKIDKGIVTAEKSDDIYSLDTKFRSKVKAPEAIAKYLLSADLNTGLVPFWYLRDMNLSPDFKVSMDTFKSYYDEIPGEPEVDGIIAIDTKVLKDLVTVLGPIDVPGSGEFTVEKDPRCHDIPQIVCELEHIVDIPIPGIKRGRKDILGPVMKTILAKIFDSPSEMWPGIFKLGMEEIEQKHVLFYFNKEEEQLAAEKLNAAGRIKDFEKDYLHVNDANFGGAKSNLFVVHEADVEIEVLDDNTIEKTLTLTYSNPEPMDNCNLERVTGLCLNGVLRNFIRVYVPKGSKLTDDLGSEVEIKTYEELDKTVFEGFFTLIGDGGTAKVVLTYELPFKYESDGNYEFLIQKQPGTQGHKYKIHFDGKTNEFDLLTDELVEL